MNINKQDKLVFAAVALASAVILFNFLMKPHLEQFKAVKIQFFSQEDLVKVRDFKKNEISEIRDSAENWEKKAASIKKKFLKKDETTAFFKRLDEWARKSGLKIYSVDSLEKTKDKNKEAEIEEMLVEVSASGTYPAIVNFSKKIFENEKFIKIDDIQINTSDDETSGILEVSMMLTLYIQ
ncbi:MAG: type 4a pilus biogenesis protein PilO [Candidatus Aadella gelida]|nr:type 4a pilus biogenesis protein PilO [Candidatus Aadella gelida]